MKSMTVFLSNKTYLPYFSRLNRSSQSIDRIEFHLTRVSDQLSVHSYRKVDDLQDGTYLFRFRLYESVKDLQLFIRFGNEDIEHVIKGYMYSDGCYCPETNLTQWFDSFDCSESSSQLREDLKFFDKIDMKQVLEKAKIKYFQHTKSYALCHYVIKNNKVNQNFIKQIYSLFLSRIIDLPKMLW